MLEIVFSFGIGVILTALVYTTVYGRSDELRVIELERQLREQQEALFVVSKGFMEEEQND